MKWVHCDFVFGARAGVSVVCHELERTAPAMNRNSSPGEVILDFSGINSVFSHFKQNLCVAFVGEDLTVNRIDNNYIK